MKIIKHMLRLITSSIILLSLFSFCNSEKAPEVKGIDYVSIPVLNRNELTSLRTHLNDDHMTEAHKSKLKTPIKDKAYFNENKTKICKETNLELIESNDLYNIARLTYSLPYVNDKTADFLDLLGERMKATFKENNLKHYKYTLTSVLRTEKDQRLLQKVNSNAAIKESSHFFGTTFDISQTRFQMTNGKEPVYSYRLRNILARELIKLQEEGKCYVILESREKCFHVTVRQ